MSKSDYVWPTVMLGAAALSVSFMMWAFTLPNNSRGSAFCYTEMNSMYKETPQIRSDIKKLWADKKFTVDECDSRYDLRTKALDIKAAEQLDKTMREVENAVATPKARN